MGCMVWHRVCDCINHSSGIRERYSSRPEPLNDFSGKPKRFKRPLAMRIFAVLFTAARRYRLLERATLVYVSLPFLVFAAGWLKPIVAIPVIALTLVGLYRAQRSELAEDSTGGVVEAPTRTEVATYAVGLVAVVFLVICSGTGGYAVQGGGHGRNNAFIQALLEHPWPLGLEEVAAGREPGVLAFYIAHALVPALVGSFLGWAAAFHAQFALTCLGVFLALSWYLRVIQRRAPLYAWLFLFFGGMDLVGYRILFGSFSLQDWPLDLWIFRYARETPMMGEMFWIFPSNLTILFHSPHHVLCSWLVMLVIVDDAIRRGTCRRAGFLAAFCLLWSAFSFVGMAPFIVLALVASRYRGMFSFENAIAGIVVLCVTVLYLGSNRGEFLHGPLWQFQNPLETWPVLALVCLLEFGVYAVLCKSVERDSRGLAHPMWFWTATGCLLLLPWYRIGKFCDFTTKASIPSLLVLQLCLAHALAGSGSTRRLRVGVLCAALLVGNVAALTMVDRSLSHGLDIAPPARNRSMDLNEYALVPGADQLFGDTESFFWKFLAKPINYLPPAELSPRLRKRWEGQHKRRRRRQRR